jgi:hypothetical protein
VNKIEFEAADLICKEAAEELKSTLDTNKWLQEHKALYESVSIIYSKTNVVANVLFEDKFYLNIGRFHDLYKHFLFELNILDHMSHEQAIVYFFEKMDIYNIDRLLDDNLTYQDIKKSQYMIYLNAAFEEMQLRKNNHLIAYTGKCEGCKPGHKSYCFIGDQDGSHIDLLIEVDPYANRIIDLYECVKMSYDDRKQPIYDKHIRIHAFKFKF